MQLPLHKTQDSESDATDPYPTPQPAKSSLTLAAPPANGTPPPATSLQIRTVSVGFYQGFNPVVAGTTKILVVLVAFILLLAPTASEHAMTAIMALSLNTFAGWYIYLAAAFVVFCATIALLPMSGRIIMGPPGARPEYGTFSWLSMMFCAGIGVGILVFSVSEPISHFQTNPDIISGRVVPGTANAAVSALRFTFLHWGISAWACYAIIAMALGLACHRFRQPLTMRSALVPLLGRRLEGWIGHAVDILSLLAIISGIVTTIVLGLEQICSGLSDLTGLDFFADQSGRAPTTALPTALIVAVAVTVTSILSGQDRGVKWVSQVGILLAFAILLTFVVSGSTMEAVLLFGQAILRYTVDAPALITTLHQTGETAAGTASRAWQNNWTVFYCAWWIAFAPFVGLFLARISYGRSLRQFVFGAILAPTLMCCVWFAGTGGTALLLELDGTAKDRILSAEHAFRVYAALDVLLDANSAMFLKGVLVVMFLLLVVASSTAAIIAIKSIGAAGCPSSDSVSHSMIWALVIAAIAGAVMAVGGITSIRNLMIAAALPFSFIMALIMISIVGLVITVLHGRTEGAHGGQAADALPTEGP